MARSLEVITMLLSRQSLLERTSPFSFAFGICNLLLSSISARSWPSLVSSSRSGPSSMHFWTKVLLFWACAQIFQGEGRGRVRLRASLVWPDPSTCGPVWVLRRPFRKSRAPSAYTSPLLPSLHPSNRREFDRSLF